MARRPFNDAHGLKEVFGFNTNAEFQTFVDDHHYMIADDIFRHLDPAFATAYLT